MERLTNKNWEKFCEDNSFDEGIYEVIKKVKDFVEVYAEVDENELKIKIVLQD